MDERTQIVGIDPGGTTGFCHIVTNEDGFDVVQVIEVPWPVRFDLAIKLEFMCALPSIYIIVESFVLYQSRAQDQVGSDFPSVKIIGMIEYFLHAHGRLDILHYQSASQIARVGILSDHLHLVKGSEHKKDAYRHARLAYEKIKRGKLI